MFVHTLNDLNSNTTRQSQKGAQELTENVINTAQQQIWIFVNLNAEISTRVWD